MNAAALAALAGNVVHLRTRAPVQGLHVLGEWYGCPRTEAIRRSERLRALCLQLVREADFEAISSLFQQFEPEGVVGTVLMRGAHLAIHTWPDSGFVAVDFYACHLTPETRARTLGFLGRLREVLRPVWVNGSEITRGVADGSER